MFASTYPSARKSTAFVLAMVMAFGSLLGLPEAASASSTATVSTTADFSAGTFAGTEGVVVGDGAVANALVDTPDQAMAVGGTAVVFDDTNWLAQTFTPTQNGYLSQVDLRVRRAANTNGVVTLELRSTVAGFPDTTPLGLLTSTTVAPTALLTTVSTVSFPFTNPVQITSGTQYALVLHRTGALTTANYNWYRENSAVVNYPDGAAYSSTDSGTTWPTTLAGDLRFKQYYGLYPASGTWTSAVFDAGVTGTKFQQLAWNESALPAGTDITMEVRASDTTFLATDISPAWISLGSTNSPADLTSILSGTYRYYQTRATLTSTDTTVTPTLLDLALTYNRPPVQNPIGPKTIDELNALSFTASGSDPDSDVLAWSLSNAPSGATIDPVTGILSWTPAEDQDGVFTFDVIASDSSDSIDAESVTVTVNEVNVVPVANDAPQTTDEDVPFTFNLTATDPDIAVQDLEFTIESDPTNGLITSFDPASGSVTYTPNAEYSGPDSLTFSVFDGIATSSLGTISLTVNAVNDAPVASDVVDSTSEDIAKAITMSATDVDSSNLTYTIITPPTNGSVNTPLGNQVTYTPNSDYSGPDSFTYSVTDDGTPAATSNIATVTIVVNSVNDAPVLSPIGSQSVDELATLTFTATATDVEVPASQSLSYVFSIPGAPAGASIDPVSGIFAWSPTEAQGPGSYDIAIMVQDNGTPVGTASEIITVTVNEVNVAPTAQNISTSVAPTSRRTITLRGADVDLPANILTYSIVTPPASGSLGPITGPSLNRVVYTPTDPNYGGPDSFTYKVNDGTVDSNTATVNITILAPAIATPAAGAYTWVQYVTLTRPNSSAIYYTIDGTTPRCNGSGTSTLYTSPIRISRTKDLKARACYGTLSSAVTTWHYDIDIHATLPQIQQLFTDGVFTTVGSVSAATSLTSTERVTIDFTENGGPATVVIPQDAVITEAGNAPFSATSLTFLDAVGTAFGNFDFGDSIYGAIRWGVDGVNLRSSLPVTVSMLLGSTTLNGATMDLIRSLDGQTNWTNTGFTPSATCVESANYCSFDTTDSGYLVAFKFDAPPAGSGSGGGSSGGSGGSSSGGGSAPISTPTPSATPAPEPTESPEASPEVSPVTTPAPTATPAPIATPLPTGTVAGAGTQASPTPTGSTEGSSTDSSNGANNGGLSINPNSANAEGTSNDQTASILGMSRKSAAWLIGLLTIAIIGFGLLRKKFW